MCAVNMWITVPTACGYIKGWELSGNSGIMKVPAQSATSERAATTSRSKETVMTYQDHTRTQPTRAA